VYDEPKHALLNKWLLLGEPDDAMAGAKGYLKISAVVLGPGDESPVSITDNDDDNDDNNDVSDDGGEDGDDDDGFKED
jgi:hypothetical protein